MAKPKTEFSIKQIVVYPSQGVGEVVDIFKKDFKGEELYYYKIYVPVSDMNIMVPVEKASSMGIRSVVDKEQALKAIELLGEEVDTPTSDWKLRYQQNIDLLHSGSVEDIAAIVRCLYHRSKIKELPAMERKLYESAKKLLEDELSYALEKSPKEIETLLHAKLEPLGAKIEKKSSSYYDDEDDDDDFNEEASRRSDSDDEEEDEDGDDGDDLDEGEE
ncbi:MAG: CarD family transcriptional regulator [Treponema sp.]|nr:CarD family transcriptional regulator [Treponema sp.]